jgi:hypothetical protein
MMQPDLVDANDKVAAEKSFKEISEAYAKLTGSENLLCKHKDTKGLEAPLGTHHAVVRESCCGA